MAYTNYNNYLEKSCTQTKQQGKVFIIPIFWNKNKWPRAIDYKDDDSTALIYSYIIENFEGNVEKIYICCNIYAI